MSQDVQSQSMLDEYFERHHEEHNKMVMRRSTPAGRMELAFEQSDGSTADAFWRFLEMEMGQACNHSGTLIVYMPHFGINKKFNRKGKIIIEIVSSMGHQRMVEDCFEFQLSRKSSLKDVRVEELKRPGCCYDDIIRYYNMSLSWQDALPLVQRIFFCEDLFTQRFLMTTASRNLGFITTQRFLSPIGQVLSFRSCVLKE